MFKLSTGILLALLLAVLTYSVSAQKSKTQIIITGQVIDSLTRKPLDFITVSLVDRTDNPVASGYTTANGTYSLSVDKSGDLKDI